MRISDWSSDVCSSDLGHAGQLLDRHPVGRVDVGLAGAIGRDAHRELPGAVPGHPALLAQQPGDVAEERHPLEGITASEWTFRCHKGIVGRWDPILTAGRTPPQPGLRRWSSPAPPELWDVGSRSEEHTSELQSLMRISYADFC